MKGRDGRKLHENTNGRRYRILRLTRFGVGVMALGMLGCTTGFGTGIEGTSWLSAPPPSMAAPEAEGPRCEDLPGCIVGLSNVSTFLDDVVAERRVSGIYRHGELTGVHITFGNKDLCRVAQRLEHLLGQPSRVRTMTVRGGSRHSFENASRDWTWLNRECHLLFCKEETISLRGSVGAGDCQSCEVVIGDHRASVDIDYEGWSIKSLSGSDETR